VDPLTQGVLGASLPQASHRGERFAVAGLLGFLAGMAPDLDVLIRSSTDPLLFLEYHRQFTHSLVFIPFGGLLCALVLHAVLGRRRGLTLRESWLFCTLGYATHAVLDACTTYGTMLFWPFSNVRIAWNTISIIDPLFTLPLLAGVILSARRSRPVYATAALCWAVLYMGLGLVQRDAAVAMGRDIAAGRGHTPLRLEAKPSFGNIIVWKVVYETPQRYYVDAVRTGISPRVFPGESVMKLVLERDFPWLEADTQQALDIERFRWFSNGYVAMDPHNPNRVIDVRYSMLPNEVNPLWSLELRRDAGPREHADYVTHRSSAPGTGSRLWQMVGGG